MTARGDVQADGRYELSTQKPGDGAPPGRDKVAINPLDTSDVPDEQKKLPFDAKYTKFETSGLEYEVKSGSNEYPITALYRRSAVEAAGGWRPFYEHQGYEDWNLWMGLAEVLAWINTRLLLGVVFFGIVTPMGVVMRFLGKDPMRRKSDPSAVTYRVDRLPRPATHMMRQF